MSIVIVMGHVKMAAGALDSLGDAMAAQIAATRAEDGCDYYGYSRDVLDPDTMIISERWRDRAALEAHFKAPHMAAFNAALGGVTVLEMSVKVYEGDKVQVLLGK